MSGYSDYWRNAAPEARKRPTIRHLTPRHQVMATKHRSDPEAAPNFGVKLVRPGSRAAYSMASVTASRRLQFATRFCERHWRQPPCRVGFGTRDWLHSLHQGR